MSGYCCCFFFFSCERYLIFIVHDSEQLHGMPQEAYALSIAQECVHSYGTREYLLPSTNSGIQSVVASQSHRFRTSTWNLTVSLTPPPLHCYTMPLPVHGIIPRFVFPAGYRSGTSVLFLRVRVPRGGQHQGMEMETGVRRNLRPYDRVYIGFLLLCLASRCPPFRAALKCRTTPPSNFHPANHALHPLLLLRCCYDWMDVFPA